MFRSFLANPIPAHIIYDPEEDEPLLDPSWPHLQVLDSPIKFVISAVFQYVMEFFLRFVVSSDVDAKVARKYIDQTFIIKVLTV